MSSLSNHVTNYKKFQNYHDQRRIQDLPDPDCGYQSLKEGANPLLKSVCTILVTDLKCDPFNTSVCRSMVAMRDVDHTGTLGLQEFQKLWDDLQNWKVKKTN